MSDITQHPSVNPPGMVVPANSRRFRSVVKGAVSEVMTDLVPTLSITDIYPVLNSTTYGSLKYANQISTNASLTTPFANWLYRGIEGSEGNMTRLAFTADTGNPSLITPYETINTSDAMTWPAVLEFLKTYINPTLPITITKANGDSIDVPRHTVVWGMRPAVSGMCALKIERFISSIPFGVRKNVSFPVPTNIMWAMPGTSNELVSCLHEEQRLKTATTAADWVTGSPQYMVFPETNMTDWTAFSWIIETSDDYFYVKEKHTIYPPNIPETSIYVK